jgi:hypothetical protein
MKTASFAFLGPATVGLLLSGCGGRSSEWATPPSGVVAQGLQSSVALVDSTVNRTLVLSVNDDLTVTPTSIPIGDGFTTSATTVDGSKLLILSQGDVPVQPGSDQGAALEVIADEVVTNGTVTTPPTRAQTYPLSSPMSNLTIDPLGNYAVVFASSSDRSFVENPNELAIVDLTQAPNGTANPVPLTLRSFGGTPQSFVFTPVLQTPGGPRRLLVVLTDRDVGLIDLSAQSLGDITVQLSATEILTPAAVTVTPGDPASGTNGSLAILLDNDPDIILVDLVPPASTAAHSFGASPTVVTADGIPTDIAFVTTNAGLRLAALVPSNNSLTLIDPATRVMSNVDLGAPFENMSLVTSQVGAAANGGDVALLWSQSSSQIAFVSLGSAVASSYSSVQTLTLEQAIQAVINVPPGPAGTDPLMLLAGVDNSTFFVLDLVTRTESPITSSGGNTTLTVAPTGDRVWLYDPGDFSLGSLTLPRLETTYWTLSTRINAAFEVTRPSAELALVTVDSEGDVDLTVLDGENPTVNGSHNYAAVLLGGVQ